MPTIKKPTLTSLLLPLLLSSTAVRATGQATINNHCAYPVYTWTAADSTGALTTIAPNGGQHVEAYTHRAAGGVSIKLARAAPATGAGNVVSAAGGVAHSQLEYTAEPGALWYDLSNIDGDPFADARVLLHPLAPWRDNCKPVDCPPGAVCSAAYTRPSDNWATHVCPADTELVLELCVSA